MNAQEVIDRLGLQPLEGEGGYFRQTWASYASEGSASPSGTAILYLVTPESWSSLHRLTYDEVFHFYLGDPCEMVIAQQDGEVQVVTLGRDIENGQRVQQVVPANALQGTKLVRGGAWALLGTTMAPGFTPECFELATLGSIQQLSPEAISYLRPFLS